MTDSMHPAMPGHAELRAHRSLERRLREAHLGRFKPLADFDWAWPKECDRTAIEELMGLQFMADASSVVLFGKGHRRGPSWPSAWARRWWR